MADVGCQTCVELLGEFVERRLPRDDEAAVQAHVDGCKACAELLRDYQELPALLRRATEEDFPLDAELRLRRMVARLRRRR